ncbi:hypothetical protein TorRG33x02_249360 [Trema orientale]|uniref:Uncharacterized protein n=1 Tax=Trema orientale TaxID=63057 RepID=A0A2P5DJJ4_TREOI|nr:hypothetical protein TorRG33x02_249360 [Trema orientale]
MGADQSRVPPMESNESTFRQAIGLVLSEWPTFQEGLESCPKLILDQLFLDTFEYFALTAGTFVLDFGFY